MDNKGSMRIDGGKEFVHEIVQHAESNLWDGKGGKLVKGLK